MSTSPTDPKNKAQLRYHAETMLKQGIAPSGDGWMLGIDALTLLYKLASVPDTAGDGLKLLHELQAHQVELELQHAQLEANEREYAEDLARYKACYDFAPVGYLIVSLDGHIMESNLAGAELLGVAQEEISGRFIQRLLKPESQLPILGLLKKLRDGGSRTSCSVLSIGNDSDSRQLQIVANISPGGEIILMVITEHDPSPRA
jgi:PAS domain S-box-containing protein